MSAFAVERRASKVPRGGAARARPGSVANDATLPPARRARYPPARIFHQSRGLPRATAPGCQRGCRADLAGHDPGRNGQTHSIARLRRDRDPKPILYEPIDPPGVPRSGRNRGHLSSTSTPALEFSVGEKDTARHPRKYLPGIGKSVSRTTFWKLQRFRYAPSNDEGPPSPEGRRSHLGARAGAAREDRERGGRGEITHPGTARGEGALGIRSRPRGAPASLVIAIVRVPSASSNTSSIALPAETDVRADGAGGAVRGSLSAAAGEADDAAAPMRCY